MDKVSSISVAVVVLLAVTAPGVAMAGEAVTAGNHGTAEFEVTDATLENETVEAGQSATVTATVENTGTANGTFTASLERDGTVVKERDVTLDAGETQDISFTLPTEDAGEYDITVNGVAAGTLTVTEPTEITTEDVSVNQTDVTTGDPIAVTATLVNSGSADGTADATLTVDGDTQESTTVTVPGNSEETVTFVYAFGETGEYDVGVNGVSGGTVTVGEPDSEPASFEISDAQLNRSTVTSGEAVEVTATVQNVGGSTATHETTLQVDGDGVESKTTSLIAPDGSETITFVYESDDPGDHSVSVDGTAAGTLTVETGDNSSDGDDGEETEDGDDGTETEDGDDGTETEDGDDEETEDGDETETDDEDDADDDDEDDEDDDRGSSGGSGTGGSGAEETEETEETEGGGGQPPTSTTNQTVDGVVLTVSNVSSGTNVTQDLSVSSPTADRAAFTLTAVHLKFEDDREGFNTTLAGNGSAPGRTEPTADGEVLGYVTIDPAVNGSAMQSAKYSIDVDNDALGEDHEMTGLRLYTYENGEWNAETTVTNPRETTLTAVASNLSTFAIVAEPTDDEEEVNGTETNESADRVLNVKSAEISADWVRSGYNTSVRTTIENPTNETQSEAVVVTVDDETVATRSVRIGPGETASLNIQFEAREGVVEVNGVNAGEVTVGDDTGENTGQTESTEGGNGGGPGIDGIVAAIALALVAMAGVAYRYL